MKNKVLDGIMGLCIGDALGVPVEFMKREELKENPVINMRSDGTYNLPAGSWSDDSSMALALLDSLKNGLNYRDIMEKFAEWFEKGKYAPYGECFDIGIGTRKAIYKYWDGIDPLECGGNSEFDNGNGSLMRILPILFYLCAKYKEITFSEEAMDIIHNISSLTHRHKRSMIACGIYISIAHEIFLGERLLVNAVNKGISKAKKFYEEKREYMEELKYYSRIFDNNFKNLTENEIKSSGYVVDTLEASIWCILNTSSYKEAVLKGVNLGEDTDTTGAVVGGLAGLFYGYENIPEEWKKVIARREWIEELCKIY